MLLEEEWERIIPIYCELFPNKPIPISDVSECAIAEDQGQIKGFLFLQNVPHMEPGGVLPGNPDVHLNSLRILLEQEMTGLEGLPYLCHTTDPSYDPAMLAAGFEPLGVLWGKKVGRYQ
jgi:hypothetical protein